MFIFSLKFYVLPGTTPSSSHQNFQVKKVITETYTLQEILIDSIPWSEILIFLSSLNKIIRSIVLLHSQWKDPYRQAYPSTQLRPRYIFYELIIFFLSDKTLLRLLEQAVARVFSPLSGAETRVVSHHHDTTITHKRRHLYHNITMRVVASVVLAGKFLS